MEWYMSVALVAFILAILAIGLVCVVHDDLIYTQAKLKDLENEIDNVLNNVLSEDKDNEIRKDNWTKN